ncbi:hypothetical protein GQ543_11475 [candidate division WOR-3 bacterium]|nr:hypothetical protein [candidate division WOR-3 bacterium]
MMRKRIFKNPIFMCAGEPSGDMYGALLIKRLKKATPNLKIYGVGGDQMRKSGVEVVEGYNELMTFGFYRGIISSFRNYKVYKKMCRAMYRVKAKTFIAVAYPGMNLLLCKYAKSLGCNTYYYLPPQIWAWGEFRKYFIKKWVDRVISIFPFECEFYKKMGIDTVYIKNPLFKELKNYNRNDFKKRIGFMPGSRRSEIKRNLPIMIEIIRKIGQKKHDLEFTLILHSSICRVGRLLPLFTSLKALLPDRIKIITENRYQIMKNCSMLILCSGTASLEAAIMNIPQVFFNRPSFFDYYISKRFLKIKEYNLANLYFNKKIVPSFVSYSTGHILRSLRGVDFLDICD